MTLECLHEQSRVRSRSFILIDAVPLSLSACSLCSPSIVAHRPKFFGRTFPPRRPQLRAPTDAKARRTSRISVATFTIINFSMMVATRHSALSNRLCPPCQFISRQAPRPIVPRPSAIENCLTMRSSSSARNLRAPKRSKLLPLRLSSKQRPHSDPWSCRPATARFMIGTPHPTALHSILRHMFLACIWWPLLAATRTPTRARSSAPTLPAAPNHRAPSRVAPLGGSDLGSTALHVNFRLCCRPAACACCICHSLAGTAHSASSRGNQLRGAVNPGASSRGSGTALAPLL